MPEKTAHASTGAPRQGPGQLLREAREKQGLAQKDIASQLNLQIETIDAVERDNDAQLPAPTYVRGYIRSYARIVHLDGDMLIRLYEQDAAGPPEIIPDIKSHHQASSNDQPVKAFTYLVGFALTLLLIAWLHSHYVVDRGAGNKGTEAAASETISPTTTAPTAESAGTETPAPLLEAYEDSPPATEEPGAPMPTGPEITDQIIGTIDIPESLAVDSTAGAITVAAENLPAAASSTTGDQIKFKLNKASWIQVYDSGNNRLYERTARAGEEINIAGTAPFNVVLGYSPGVEILFNGEPFNPEPFSNHGTARFTLEAQEITE